MAGYRLVIGILSAGCAIGAPRLAHGEEVATTSVPSPPPKKPDPRYRALEVQGIVTAFRIPRPFFGVDTAVTLAREIFHLRMGAIVSAAPALPLGDGSVHNVVMVGQVDGCIADWNSGHRIRICAGIQAGGWRHFWHDVPFKGKRWSPWVAPTLKGDYHYAFTDRFGLMFGAGVSVPVVGPIFQHHDRRGGRSTPIYPGPVEGSFTAGMVVRFL
jgi:hypothetical protein